MADPTSQGLNLRGVGPSGVSRALVLLLAFGAAPPEPPGAVATPEPTPPKEAPGATAEPSPRPAAEEPPIPTVVVTGTRAPRPVRDVPATVVVLPRAEIDRSPTLTTDDLLRTVPSVGTFRRSSSLVADPTSQGLNLRGVGPSGVSRALVLLDGVPVNDPFGGWVYWRALPRLGLDRIEIVPGGGSASYGNYALGGVVQLFSRPIAPATLEGDVLAGHPGTLLLGARVTERWGRVGAELEGEWLESAGYPLVPEAERGAIDVPAASRHGTLNGRVEVALTDTLTLTLRAGSFGERQSGGTAFTNASVGRLGYSAGVRRSGGDGGTLELSFFGHAQRFRQQRARISADRSTEALSAEQDVPTDDQGASFVWTGAPAALLGTHSLVAGAELRRISGVSRERLFPASTAPGSLVGRDGGGEQQFGALFAQDLYSVSPSVQLLGALRLDLWRNLGASRTLTRADGTRETVAFDERRHAQLNPRLGVLYRPVEWLGLRASGYRAFRAPTLNELYRPFQVGTILTAA
ncbi:MAG TPA: TonB-dependent receptor, partial [Longimicrobium sp.]|nr:TonB-dependent receptor [Longimicrobium sp.]